ncbi:hypothetical protein GUH47_26075 [Xanthomonas citri pv. citri]|nr:hypothetical protein ART_00084 [Achromobacter phage vB_Ade_ART]MBD4209382.1 hypothetical protein [Xanthomonas citri pv. citri]
MPYSIVDKDQLRVIGTVSTATIAAQIEMVYFKDTPTCVLNSGEGKSFSQLSELELRMLLKTLKIPTEGVDYSTMITYLKYWVENAPVVDPDQEGLDYISGIMRNEVMKPPERGAHEPVERKSRPSKGEGSAPSPKGSTGRVWEIAEGCLLSTGSGDLKVLRAEVIRACVAGGIHEATAATQWSKWKKSKGL